MYTFTYRRVDIERDTTCDTIHPTTNRLCDYARLLMSEYVPLEGGEEVGED